MLAAANTAFVDAMTTGFQISAAILMTAVIIAFTLIPRRMRTEQAGATEAREPLPAFRGEPVPQPAAA